MKRRGLRFLTKRRNKYRSKHSGYRITYYCENCRIKDGLSTSQLVLEICSFCGRKTRCYIGSTWWHTSNTVAKAKTPWYWKRGKALWKDHKL